MRHLSERAAIRGLERGPGIEQLLPSGPVDGQRTVRWLAAWPIADGWFRLVLHHVFDQGDGELCDVTEFSPVGPGEYRGEGAEIACFDAPKELLDYSQRLFGASPVRWVTQGMIGDEYRDARDPG